MKKIKLPANPIGLLAVVVVGSFVANRFHQSALRVEAKLKAKASRGAE